jgi:hypothetical protein
MDVIIGVQARDGMIKVDIPDAELDAFKARVEDAFKSGENQLLWVTDKDGHEVAIPTDKIAFVELGSQKATRTVGFSSEE